MVGIYFAMDEEIKTAQGKLREEWTKEQVSAVTKRPDKPFPWIPNYPTLLTPAMGKKDVQYMN